MKLVHEWLETGNVDVSKWDRKVPDRVLPERREQIAVMEEGKADRVFLKPAADGSLIAEIKQVKQQAKEWVPVYDEKGNGIDAIERPVFEEKVTPEQRIKREHYAARIFKALVDGGLKPNDPKSVADYIIVHNALPGLPTEEEFAERQGKISMGEMQTRSNLAMQILTQAFLNLSERVSALERVKK